MQINDSTAECKQLKLSVLDPKCNLKITGYAGYTVEGVAMFAGPIMTGRITFVSEQLHPVHNPLTRSCLCAIYLHFAAACKLFFSILPTMALPPFHMATQNRFSAFTWALKPVQNCFT